MFDNIASIDIGYSSIKLIKAKRGIRKFEIISVSFEEYDLDLFSDNNSAHVNDAILRLIKREDLTDFIVITTFPSDTIIFRNISFPFSDINKISDTLQYEAEESIPYPIDQVSLAFQTLPASTDSGRSIILSAMTKEHIEEKIRNMEGFGSAPQFAGLEANAHLRCYEYFNSVNNENILVIDLGHKKTIIDIISNSALLFTRSINTGISELIEFISETLTISLNDAKKTLIEMELDLSSYDTFINNDSVKRTGIAKTKLKKIHEYASSVI